MPAVLRLEDPQSMDEQGASFLSPTSFSSSPGEDASPSFFTSSSSSIKQRKTAAGCRRLCLRPLKDPYKWKPALFEVTSEGSSFGRTSPMKRTDSSDDNMLENQEKKLKERTKMSRKRGDTYKVCGDGVLILQERWEEGMRRKKGMSWPKSWRRELIPRSPNTAHDWAVTRQGWRVERGGYQPLLPGHPQLWQLALVVISLQTCVRARYPIKVKGGKVSRYERRRTPCLADESDIPLSWCDEDFYSKKELKAPLLLRV